MVTFEDLTRHDDFDPDDDPWVGARPDVSPIAVVEPDPSWPAQFEERAERVRRALGDRVLEIEHVGSTSVPDLPAKPVIDIDLTVADSSDEPAYVPALETQGFVLRIREPRWHEHRCLTATSPRCNLHVWTPHSYAAVKRASADASNSAGGDVMSHNLRKQPVLREILDRMFRAHGML